MKNRAALEKWMDKINAETINCRESVMAPRFKEHANRMMRDVYQLDSIIHRDDLRSTFHILRQLKAYVKQLQHPIMSVDNDISSETYNEITYVLYCLGDLADELEL